VIARLIIFIILFALPVVGGGAWVRARRRRQRVLHAAKEQGLLNAALTCPDCFQAVDPEGDDVIYAANHFRHRRCYQKLLQ